MSVITIGELRARVLAAGDVDSRDRRLATLTQALALRPVPVDDRVADAWARLWIQLRDHGQRMPSTIPRIVATAIASGSPSSPKTTTTSSSPASPSSTSDSRSPPYAQPRHGPQRCERATVSASERATRAGDGESNRVLSLEGRKSWSRWMLVDVGGRQHAGRPTGWTSADVGGRRWMCHECAMAGARTAPSSGYTCSHKFGRLVWCDMSGSASSKTRRRRCSRPVRRW